MKLTMIRHTSVDVPRGICYGRTDVPLKDTFEQEAEAVKAQLAGDRFDAVFCSPLSRCRRLAEYCGMDNIIFDERLLEINFGEWEMQPFDAIKDPRIGAWYEDFYNVPATGGESFAQQHMRLRAFLDELAAKDYQSVAIFTHGGILMQTMLIMGMATLDNIFDRQPAYGEVMRVNLTKKSPL